MTYHKEINLTLSIFEDDSGAVEIAQKNPTPVRCGYEDIVVLSETEAIEVYRFLHRKFGGS